MRDVPAAHLVGHVTGGASTPQTCASAGQRGYLS
jgi:hypothetical protein